MCAAGNTENFYISDCPQNAFEISSLNNYLQIRVCSIVDLNFEKIPNPKTKPAVSILIYQNISNATSKFTFYK